MSTRSPGLTLTVPSAEENSVRGRAGSDLSPMSTITSVSVTLSTVQLTTSPAAIGDNRSMLSKRLRISAASDTLEPTADSLASITGGGFGGSPASPLAIRPALTLGPAEAEPWVVIALCVSGTVPGASEETRCPSENIFHLVSSRTRRLTGWENPILPLWEKRSQSNGWPGSGPTGPLPWAVKILSTVYQRRRRTPATIYEFASSSVC